MNVQKISQCCEEKLQNKGSNSDEQPINGYEEKNESKDVSKTEKISKIRFINEIVSNHDARVLNWRNGKNKNQFIGDVYCPISIVITENMESIIKTFYYKFYEISVSIDYIYTIDVKPCIVKEVKEEHKTKYEEKKKELTDIFNIKYSDSVTNSDVLILEEIFNTRFKNLNDVEINSLFEVIIQNLSGKYSNNTYTFSTAGYTAMDMSDIIKYKTLVKLDKELSKEKHNKYRVYGVYCKDSSSSESKSYFNSIFGEGNCCLVLKFDKNRIYFSSTGIYSSGARASYTYYKDIRIIRNQKVLLSN